MTFKETLSGTQKVFVVLGSIALIGGIVTGITGHETIKAFTQLFLIWYGAGYLGIHIATWIGEKRIKETNEIKKDIMKIDWELEKGMDELTKLRKNAELRKVVKDDDYSDVDFGGYDDYKQDGNI
jgi:hypothetical protein